MLTLRFRAEWRRRWGTLLAFTFLVGVVGATVLATYAGSRRTRSVVERADAALHIPDAFALLQPGSFKDADTILASPVVDTGDRLAIFQTFVATGYIPVVASVDGHLGRDMFIDRVVQGRRPGADAPLEVALPEATAKEHGYSIGSRLPFHSAAPDQSACLLADEEVAAADPKCAELLAQFGTDDPDLRVLRGPSFELEVVGITRPLNETDDQASELQTTYLSPAFFDAYKATIPYIPAVFARFAPGVTDADFEHALSTVVSPETISDFTYTSTEFDALDATAATLADGLLIFSAVALVAGLVAITQALARQVAAGALDADRLRALGASRRERALDPLVGLVPVAVGGALLAIAGAWLASPLMPIGTARTLEVARGLDFDTLALFVGGALLSGFVLATAWVVSAWIQRSRPASNRARFPAALGATVPTGLGVRWALSPGRAENAVPVRSAMSGVALGVAGLVAVVSFAQGLNRLTDDARRTGWGWDVAVTGERAGDTDTGDDADQRTVEDERAARLLAEPGVDGVMLGWLALRVPVGGRSVPAVAFRPYEGDLGFVVVDGRVPRGNNEVALGAKTMRHSDVAIGDDVHVGARRMRVVGQAVFPNAGDGFPLADGALFAEEGMQALGTAVARDQAFTSYAVKISDDPGRRAAVLARLANFNRDEPPVAQREPSELRQLHQLDSLPFYLAAFLFVVAALALAHALVLTVRRRRRDVAVLRSLGATRGQSSRTIAWQASTIAVVGVALGLPLGLLLGRIVWGTVARSYGVADDTPWPVLAVLIAFPVTLVIANAIAWWPGRKAARIAPSEALRTE